MGWICLFAALATCVWAILNRRLWWGWIVAGGLLLLRAVLEGQAGDPLFIAGLFAYLGGCVLPTFPPWSRSLLDPEQGQALQMEEVFDAIEQLRSQAPQLWSEARTQTGQLLDHTGRAARTVAKAGAKLWVERLHSEKGEAPGDPLDPSLVDEFHTDDEHAEPWTDQAAQALEAQSLESQPLESFADYEDFADFLEVEFSDEPALSFESDPFLQEGEGWIEADLSGLAEEIAQAGEQPAGPQGSSSEIAAALEGLAAWGEFQARAETEVAPEVPVELSTIEDEMSSLLDELETWDPQGESNSTYEVEVVAGSAGTFDLSEEAEAWDQGQPNQLEAILEGLEHGPEQAAPRVEASAEPQGTQPPAIPKSTREPVAPGAFDPWPLVSWDLPLPLQGSGSAQQLTPPLPEELSPIAPEQNQTASGIEERSPAPTAEPTTAFDLLSDELVSEDLEALEREVGEWLVDSSNSLGEPDGVLDSGVLDSEALDDSAFDSATENLPSADSTELPGALAEQTFADGEEVWEAAAGTAEIPPSVSEPASLRAEETEADSEPEVAPLQLAAPFDEAAPVADATEAEPFAGPAEVQSSSAIEFEAAFVDSGLPGGEVGSTAPEPLPEATAEPHQALNLDEPDPPFPVRSRPTRPSLMGLFRTESTPDQKVEPAPADPEPSGVESAPWTPLDSAFESSEDDDLTFGPAIGPLDLPFDGDDPEPRDDSSPRNSGEPEAPFGRSAPSKPGPEGVWRTGGPQTQLPPLGPIPGPSGPSSPFFGSASQGFDPTSKGPAPGSGGSNGPENGPQLPSSGPSSPPQGPRLILPGPLQAAVVLPGKPLDPRKLRSFKPASGLRNQPSGPIGNLVTGSLSGRASGPLHAELLTLAWELVRRHPRLRIDSLALYEALRERAESLSPAAGRFLERLSPREVADLARLLP